MKRPILVILLALATIFTSALYASATPGEKPCNGPRIEREEPGGRFLERMSKVLDLTEVQQVAIKKIQTAEKEKTATLHEQKRENRRKLHQLESAQPFDENAVRTLATELSMVETELMVARARTHSHINAVLTAQQRELAEKLRPEPGERHKKGQH